MPPSYCDFSWDGHVGVEDLMLFINAFGCLGPCDPYDLDADEDVGIADVQIFISEYGHSCW